MALFKKNAVREGVLRIINDRLDDAQADYEEGVERIGRETSEAISNIVEASTVRKESLLDECIASVVS